MKKHEGIERDVGLGASLTPVSGAAPADEVAWGELRRRIGERTAPVLGLRRATVRRRRGLLGTAVAASVALLFLVSRAPDGGSEQGSGPLAAGASLTLEQILESDVSDEELSALLAGGADAEELLLLAASDSDL